MVISKELVEVKDKFGDERRTTILNSSADIEIEDLVPDMDVVITLSHEGYVKYQQSSPTETGIRSPAAGQR